MNMVVPLIMRVAVDRSLIVGVLVHPPVFYFESLPQRSLS